MRKFKGSVSTNNIGSTCEFEFEVDDNATQEEIEEEARQSAFDCVEWNYTEITKGDKQ